MPNEKAKTNRFGTPLSIASPDELMDGDVPEWGNDWDISAETRREIEIIDENIRASEQMSGQLLMG
ncbi:MAG: hypothetical protein ACPGOV_01910 [Magnetovibrionaceae bacterium]